MVQAATIVHQLQGDLHMMGAAGAELASCPLRKQTRLRLVSGSFWHDEACK